MKVLETERLVLRHAETHDAPFILGLLNEPSFIENIGDRNVRTLEGAQDYISTRMIASYEKNGYGLYVCELKPNHELIGLCGLVKRDFFEHADVGFAFLPAFWRKGFAFEAAQRVLDFAKEELGHRRVLGITTLTNVGSIAVLEKLGLKYQKTEVLPEHVTASKIFSVDL